MPLTGNTSVDEYFKPYRFKCKEVKEFIFDERDLSNTGDGFRDICNSLCYFPNLNVIKIISYDLRGSRMQWFSEAIQNRYLIHLKSLIFESILNYIFYSYILFCLDLIFDRKTFTLLHDGISHLKEYSITELNFTSCDIEPEGYMGLLSLFKDKLLPNLERLVMPKTEVTTKFCEDLKDLLYKAPCPNLLQVVLTVEPTGIYELQKCIQCEACQSFKNLELVLPTSNISDILTNISKGKPLTCKTIENPCIYI